MQRWHRLVLAVFLLGLWACSGPAKPSADIAPVLALLVFPTATPTALPTPTPAPSPTVPAQAFTVPPTKTASPAPTPTATPSPEPSPTPVNWLDQAGRTADGLMYLGNPDAPVSIIDYSDFL